MSGPLGAGEVIGEMVGPTRGGAPKRDIFIGKSAKTYDPIAEQRAIEMEKAGIDRDTIWRETGTGRIGGDWKQEISDVGAYLRQEPDFEKAIDQRKAQIAFINQRVKQLKEGAKEQPDLFPREFNRSVQELAATKKPLQEDIKGNFGLEWGKAGYLGSRARLAMEHPELFEAYPDLGQDVIVRRNQSLGADTRGRFRAEDNRVDIGSSLRGKPVEETSTALHELQHAVQELEGFPRGGNPDIARQALEQQFGREMQPLQNALYKRLEAGSKSSMASRAQYAQKLKDLQTKENIRPRELLNLSDWYQYGTRVADELQQRGLGWQMPREKGATRDRWIQEAVRTMQRMIEEKNPEMRGIERVMTPSQAKREMAKTSRTFRETQDEALKASKLQDKYSAMRGKTDFDLYQRLAGEAEARAVQKRMNMTPAERRQTPPWQSFDVPEQEFIYRR